MFYLILFFIFIIYLVPIVCFFVNLCLYASAKKKNIKRPDSVSAKKMKKYKIMMIVSSIIAVFIIGSSIVDYFSIDRTAEMIFEGVRFKGEDYHCVQIAFTEEGKTIGMADDWDIKEIPEDKEHNFLGVRSFLDNFYVVKDSYVIPTEGNINVVYIDDERYTDVEFKNAVEYILNDEIHEKFNILTDNIYHHAKEIYIGYEDCPVGTEFIGMIGYANNKLVYIKPTERIYKDKGTPDEQIYCCYVIPSPYKETFEKYPYYINDEVELAP